MKSDRDGLAPVQAGNRGIRDRIETLSRNRPLVFSLLVLLSWFLLGAVLVLGSATWLRVPAVDDVPQMVGTLGAILILLVLVWRLGWLRAIGIDRLGSWQIWLLAIPLLAYLLSAYWIGFFGNLTPHLVVWVRSDAARAILARQAVVGFVEETLFRGIILAVLVRAWGRTLRGLMAAVLVQAVLFGAIHMLQVGVGSTVQDALMVTLNGCVSGVWWGAIVLAWGTVWPAIVFHGASNAAVLIKGLTSVSIQPSVAAYARATALELPLLVLGIWLLWRAAASGRVAAAEVVSSRSE